MATAPPEGNDYGYTDEGWELHDEPARERFYTLDGKRKAGGKWIISVTTALKIIDKSDVLVYWATQQIMRGVCELLDSPPTRKRYAPRELENALRLNGYHPQEALKAAGARGNGEHQAMEKWVLSGVLPPPTDPTKTGFRRALAQWLRDVNPDVYASEMMLGSEEHAYAGTFDLLYRDRETGDLVLADIKTSKRMYPGTHYRQLGAYEMARREMGMPHASRACIILLKPDGSYEVHWMDEFSHLGFEDWGERFRLALALYRQEAAIEAMKRRYEKGLPNV